MAATKKALKMAAGRRAARARRDAKLYERAKELGNGLVDQPGLDMLIEALNKHDIKENAALALLEVHANRLNAWTTPSNFSYWVRVMVAFYWLTGI